MRLLTSSPFERKGLISIVEADENGPQNVVFCIPIEAFKARMMESLYEFDRYFSNGISTKIIDEENTTIINLDYVSPLRWGDDSSDARKFVADIKGHLIDFYLSPLNFLPGGGERLAFEFAYTGDYLKDDLSGQKLIILQPNWEQLDKLFIEERIVFTDWK